ncbi:MAG TPA: glycosyltransferase family 2 protein [Alphaproteobacteria bacterium]|nr:glycosyltransferase family 2 protein [Alphaproteobacteria bacterium]
MPLDPALELSIVMPCLDEARTLPACLAKARDFLTRHNVNGEIVVADNGSTDGSQDIARAGGARVVEVADKGYGAALAGGIAAAGGRYVIMGDADDSYDFSALMPILDGLRGGNQMVVGNRFKGGIAKGAMPFLNRYLGNPVLSALGKLFFRIPVGDFHCGLRGFERDAVLGLDLRTTGMEYASEMIVSAALHGFTIAEVPVTLSPDGRGRPPHLHPWRDGWRHLRFLLLYSPRWLYLYPGLFMIAVGSAIAALLLPGPLTLASGIGLDVHTLLVAAMTILVGVQGVTFGLVARSYALKNGILPGNERYEKIFAGITLERMLILAGVLILIGLAGVAWAIQLWSAVNFGPLNYSHIMRILIVAVTGIVGGMQLGFAAFLLGVMQIKHK